MTAIRPHQPGDAGPIAPKVPHVLYGADFNPEQWDRDVWRADVRLMQEAGVNLVSLGIFSWAQLEPRPGDYDLGWLDEVMDLLHTHGIAVDLATATASPPPWLAARHRKAPHSPPGSSPEGNAELAEPDVRR